jgi:hypothetical protein
LFCIANNLRLCLLFFFLFCSFCMPCLPWVSNSVTLLKASPRGDAI